MINQAWMEGKLSFPTSPPASEDYPVIQYADDTLIILPASPEELITVKLILDSYAKATGLKINYGKSQLMPINISDNEVQDLASLLGCQVGNMPFTYLGLPMGTTKPSITDLMPLVDRIERKLTSTSMWLSFGGRLQLINSALSSLISYTMCVIKIPDKILDLFDRARRHCLWRKTQDINVNAHSLAAWHLVCRPKKGGSWDHQP